MIEPVAPEGYSLDHVLGHGSMGVVYAASHVRTGQSVAIKWLTATREKQLSALQRFERGAVPFPDVKNFVRFLLHATSNAPPPVHEVAPWVSTRISHIVEQATRLDREQRYPNARAMLDAIREVLPGTDGLRSEMLVGVHSAA